MEAEPGYLVVSRKVPLPERIHHHVFLCQSALCSQLCVQPDPTTSCTSPWHGRRRTRLLGDLCSQLRLRERRRRKRERREERRKGKGREEIKRERREERRKGATVCDVVIPQSIPPPSHHTQVPLLLLLLIDGGHTCSVVVLVSCSCTSCTNWRPTISFSSSLSNTVHSRDCSVSFLCVCVCGGGGGGKGRERNGKGKEWEGKGRRGRKELWVTESANQQPPTNSHCCTLH